MPDLERITLNVYRDPKSNRVYTVVSVVLSTGKVWSQTNSYVNDYPGKLGRLHADLIQDRVVAELNSWLPIDVC